MDNMTLTDTLFNMTYNMTACSRGTISGNTGLILQTPKSSMLSCR
jgi:hypothetical protein